MTRAVFTIAVQWFGIGIFFFLLIYSTLQKPSEMQKHMTVLTIASILFLGGYLIRLSSDDIHSALLGATMTYMGQPFVLLSALMLISTFFNYNFPKAVFIALAMIAASVPIIVFTNPQHYLFYATMEFDPNAAFSPLITTHGPLYNANLVMALAYFVAYVMIIVTGYRRVKSPLKQRLSVYSVLMLFSGIIGYVLYFFHLTGGYDSTMLGVSMGSVFLFLLFFRCRIFDIVDKAKDYALDISQDGLVVYDDANDIVYKNAPADRLMEKDIPADFIRDFSGGEAVLNRNERHYAVKAQPITRRDSYLGKSVEIHDITDSFNYQRQLEEAVQRTTEHLETVQRTIFGSMASIVEARSLETGDHIKRVSAYTEMIARALRDMGKYTDLLTEEYISSLALSAPLHDIGKISIPDAILLKPGKLTDEEFEIIKSHSAKGAEIIRTTMEGLESEEYIAMASDTALYHHERWDGKGYPCKLAGAAIPLSSRIVALADCYDAMTSKRCYKDAFPDEKALNIILEERGTHFDPDVVDAFLRCSKK